jgi:hypothetical protein
VENAFLNRPLLKKDAEKEMWDERGREGEREKNEIRTGACLILGGKKKKELKSCIS